MKFKTFPLLLLCLPALFTQCAINKRVVSNKDSNLVDSLLIIPVYSNISIVTKGDKVATSEMFSIDAEDLIEKQLKKYIPTTVSTKYLEQNDPLKPAVIPAYMKLIKSIKISLMPDSVKVPEEILIALDSLHQNYALFVYQYGFTRTVENFKNQYIKRRAINVTTLGIYNTVPNSSYSTMIAVLVDKNRKKISMYKELYWRNKNPIDEVVIGTQLRDIILTYFNSYK